MYIMGKVQIFDILGKAEARWKETRETWVKTSH